MKRYCLLGLLFGFLCVARLPLYAQFVADPNDRLYLDLSLWQDRGLIRDLPQLRPYPIQLVKTLLNEVKTKGDTSDGERADRYLAELEGLLRVHVDVGAEARTNFSGAFFQPAFRFQYQGIVSPFVTYSGTFGALALNAPENSMLPTYQRSTQDYIYDGAATELKSTGLTPYVFMISDAGFGSDSIYGQAGIVRSSFGPFWGDNAVLSPFAPEAGRFSFVYREGVFTYTGSLFVIAATQNNGGGLPSPGKFLALHSVEIYPWPWLTFSLFESMVWGQRFEPLYLLPFPTVYQTAEGLVGFPDKAHIGLSTSLLLPEALKVDFLVYVDDVDVPNVLQLNFNTMLRFAMQVGISWTPSLPVLARLSLNGLIIMPYDYAAADTSNPTDINYTNYTNAGQNMGPSLPPDSARVELNALLRPWEILDLNVFGRLILHGDASEGIPGGGDGSLFDAGLVNGQRTFSPPYPLPPGFVYTRFLTQAITGIFQTGFDAKTYIDTPFGQVQAAVSYTFEYVLNTVNNYVGLRVEYQY